MRGTARQTRLAVAAACSAGAQRDGAPRAAALCQPSQPPVRAACVRAPTRERSRRAQSLRSWDACRSTQARATLAPQHARTHAKHTSHTFYKELQTLLQWGLTLWRRICCKCHPALRPPTAARGHAVPSQLAVPARCAAARSAPSPGIRVQHKLCRSPVRAIFPVRFCFVFLLFSSC